MPIPFLSSIGLNKNEVQDFKVFNLASDPTLTASGDLGYLWLNTTNAGAVIPTLKWWDGTNIRSLIDSTNIGSFTSGLATDLAGGGAGQIVYQDAVNDTKFLAAGTSGQVLSSNAANAPSWVNQSSLAAGTAANISGGLAGQLLYQSALATTAKLTIGTAGQALVVNAGATAPQWVDQSSFSVGSATNKTGGTIGDILVQSGSGATSFLNVGTNGQVITSNGTSPQYVNQSTLSVGSATTSGTATNIAGGAANRIPYQTAAGTTAFITDAANSILTTNASSVPGLTASISVTVGKAVDIALGAAGDLLYQSASNDTSFLNIGANGQVLTSSGSAPQWSNQSSLSVGSATTAGSVTNALTAGSYLTSTGTFNGSAARTFAVDATDANTASKVVARDAYGNFSAGTITATTVTGLSAPSAGSDAANRNYVDSVAQGLDVKASCLVATTGDITLSSPGAISIDNIPSTSFTSGTTRILVRAQSTASQNGIYIWNGPSSAMTRSADADTWDELVSAFTFIEKGDTLRDTGWVCTVDAGGTLGTTAITWSQFSGAGSYTAGRGMVLDGTAFNFAQSTNYTADTIPYASGATTIGFIGAGTADQVLRVPGAGGTPAFGAIDLSKSAAVTGTLAVGNGGTGQSTYAVGDILFADGATSLAKLADVATGNALISGGVATAPSWGKIGLTTHVSGTLPIANGGTGATTFTAGRVLFGNGTSALNTSGNLFWDNTNSRLGIGTATPATNFHVSGGSSYFTNGSGSAADIEIAGNNNTAGTGSLLIRQSASNEAMVWNRASAALTLGTASVEKFRIASDGVCTWSNVVNAGTAMTLNGTGLGVGTDPTGFGRLVVRGTAAGAGYLGVDSDATRVDIQSYNKPLAINRSGNNVLFCEGGGNVGIGTATPAVKFHLSGSDSILALLNGATKGVRVSFNAGESKIEGVDNTGTGSYQPLSIGGSEIRFDLSNSRKATLDASGNLGLGVTPNTWAAVFKAIQFPDGYAAIAGDNGNGVAEITSNAYNDGAWKFRNAQGAVRYRLDAINKTHTWFNTSTTPTANGAITWTPAMTLDSSGKLGIGSTPSTNLSIGSGSGSGGYGGGVYLNRGGSSYNFYEAGDGTNTVIFGLDHTVSYAKIGSINSYPISLVTNNSVRLTVKATGQVNFTGLASDPAGAAGDVVYNSTSNRLKYHNGTAWVNTGTNKYSGALTGTGTSFTVTHNLGTRDVTVAVRKSGSTYDQVFTDVQMTDTNTVTIIFASSVTGSDYTVTVIG